VINAHDVGKLTTIVMLISCLLYCLQMWSSVIYVFLTNKCISALIEIVQYWLCS